MTSPWAQATRKAEGGNGSQVFGGGNTGAQNPNAQNAFVFDPNKPASNQQIPYQNESVSNAAKGFSFGPRPGPPDPSGGRPLLGGGSGSGPQQQPIQSGIPIGRGSGARVLYKPTPQPGPSHNVEEEEWGLTPEPPPLPTRQQPSERQSNLKFDTWDNALADGIEKPAPPNAPATFPQSQSLSAASSGQGQQTGEEELRPDEASLICKALHRKMGLIKTKADLEVIHRDPNSPLHSVKSFEELNLTPELLQGIYGMGFRYPSRIQETALPILLFENPRHNLIAQSQSGTGKTAAFVLTMLSRIDVARPYPQALCVAPTYELALQIGAVTEEMGRYMNGLNVGYAVRGSAGPGDSGPISSQVIIGTPGTVVDWGLKFRKIDLSKLVVFVLDEADVMIAMQGHRDSSFRIKTKLSPNCQLLLFSATYDDEVFDFAQKMVPNADIIKLKREELSLENVKQFVVKCQTDQDKYEAICSIYGSITVGQSMIFCERRDAADRLAEKMSKDGHQVGLLHGGLTIDQRANIIERFREAKERVLITTNVAARGIDIEQVTVVVNYDLPIDMKSRRIDFDTYLHRIGRTGRFGRVGLALNLISSSAEMEHIRTIEGHFNRKIEALDVSDLESLATLGDAQ